eukprot:CAMPEP_0184300206 /NCGR_PEP_ID=MMETSP1049-20130417/10672_1 /TAXON_ID=77928 /ORGANISM="Proteomonas sulcata, Strain CCMP704" /LENGTH=51 /DNA_ID=CAMNT_0026610867 /DNA_START=471 /DNA_END=626 /DNA_ORIENTATION=-
MPLVSSRLSGKGLGHGVNEEPNPVAPALPMSTPNMQKMTPKNTGTSPCRIG